MTDTLTIDFVEGNRQWLDGGGMFGHVPRGLWSKWVEADAIGRVELAGRCMLVRTESKTILLDAGIGLFFEPKLRDRYGVMGEDHRLLANLQQLGVAPEEIDLVILSHMHFDHVGGLVSIWEEGPPRLVFPRALFYVSSIQWQRALHPTPRDRVSYIPWIFKLLEESGRLRFIDEEGPSPIDPRLEFIFSHGHTPGMIMTRLRRENEPDLCFVGDLIPGTHWVHLPVVTAYDRFAELSMEEKRLQLDWSVETGGLIAFYHDPKTACVRIQRSSEEQYRYIDSN